MTSPELSYVSDAIKQVLTLATGVLALSFTFHTQFSGNRPSSQQGFLYAGWAVLLGSVLLGVFCLLTVTGAVWNAQTSKTWLVRVPWALQLVTFAVGVALLVVFAFQVV